jgi:hypothetical protein
MFVMPFKTWLQRAPARRAGISVEGLNEIRLKILASLADCKSSAADRVRAQVRSTRSGSDLLLLRGEIYQLLACEHCEAEARRRVDDLLPALASRTPSGAIARF